MNRFHGLPTVALQGNFTVHSTPLVAQRRLVLLQLARASTALAQPSRSTSPYRSCYLYQNSRVLTPLGPSPAHGYHPDSLSHIPAANRTIFTMSSSTQLPTQNQSPADSQAQHRRPSFSRFLPAFGSAQDRLKRSWNVSFSSSTPTLVPVPSSASDYSRSSAEGAAWSESSSDDETPSTPETEIQDELSPSDSAGHIKTNTFTEANKPRASTQLLAQRTDLFDSAVRYSESGTQLIQKFCCGGGCCLLNLPPSSSTKSSSPVTLPDNATFTGLGLKLENLSQDSELTNIAEVPTTTLSFENIPKSSRVERLSTVATHPPQFVQPHPPYHVFSAPLYSARELTKPGAEKRTFHFDVDVTDYPDEGDVDFKVGGAIGVSPPNRPQDVEEIFDILGVPRFLRDRPTTLKTIGGRWPTVWGEEQERTLTTTRREILTWCTDIQSYAPTKKLLRLLAEHASAANEKKILLYLCSGQGQSAFCEMRSGPHLCLLQLLKAFPSSRPPLPELLSVLSQLMPRFYSLSNDPHISSAREGLAGRRLIELAVTVHETNEATGVIRKGVGSGFLERIAKQFIETAETQSFEAAQALNLRVPIFRGLMSNPLSREFEASDGPMMLIGAGVGMAPFRGFILNRLRKATCANKIWLVQGIRDSSVDELYSGELGKYESQIKRVVQSRARKNVKHRLLADDARRKSASETDLSGLRLDEGTSSLSPSDNQTEVVIDSLSESKYVQDEVRQQADIVWDVIKAVDGRVFVCGSSKGMGEGVEQALHYVAMKKGMTAEAAVTFWQEMKDVGKYIAETW